MLTAGAMSVVSLVLVATLVQALAFQDIMVESGSQILQNADNSWSVVFPNKTILDVKRGESVDVKAQDSLPQQWLAWYFRSCLSGVSFGFTSFSSVFEVPPVPDSPSNLAVFNALQASYDPVPYNWILQPVLSIGRWMLGTSSGWTLSSVMCDPNTGKCLYTDPIDTKPGNKILGVITQVHGSPSSYEYEVNITDMTANTPTMTLKFSSEYFAPWAFVALEHSPEGEVSDCSTLPDTPAITFTENKLEPNSMDMWQGSQTEYSCGISVDMFPTTADSHLDIKL